MPDESGTAEPLQGGNVTLDEVRFVAIKCTLDTIRWREDLRSCCTDLVNSVHTITTQAYNFAKFIFINEVANDPWVMVRY
jgi:hypothetical protein